MGDKFKEIYVGAFLIATTIWLLVHLMLIELYGLVRISEPHQWILRVEVVFAIVILALSIEWFVDDWKNIKR